MGKSLIFPMVQKQLGLNGYTRLSLMNVEKLINTKPASLPKDTHNNMGWTIWGFCTCGLHGYYTVNSCTTSTEGVVIVSTRR
jgi:hypothetical protein